MQRRDSAHASACLGGHLGIHFDIPAISLPSTSSVLRRHIRSPRQAFSPPPPTLLFFSLFLRMYLSENVFEFLVYGSPEIPSIVLLLEDRIQF